MGRSRRRKERAFYADFEVKGKSGGYVRTSYRSAFMSDSIRSRTSAL